jgi:flavodoxin I
LKPIGLFYGSTNGATAAIAERIKEQFESAHQQPVELLDISEYYLEELADFDQLILGIPTWDRGQLQRDWEAILEEFDQLDLSRKRVAIFGLGDQIGYPDTFLDAVFFLAEKVRERGATLVGQWSTEGYQFTQSWAVEDGKFLGLALDEENQSALSEPRIHQWVELLMQELFE